MIASEIPLPGKSEYTSIGMIPTDLTVSYFVQFLIKQLE